MFSFLKARRRFSFRRSERGFLIPVGQHKQRGARSPRVSRRLASLETARLIHARCDRQRGAAASRGRSVAALFGFALGAALAHRKTVPATGRCIGSVTIEAAFGFLGFAARRLDADRVIH